MKLTRREHWLGRLALLLIGVGIGGLLGWGAALIYVGVLLIIGLGLVAADREKSL